MLGGHLFTKGKVLFRTKYFILFIRIGVWKITDWIFLKESLSPTQSDFLTNPSD